MIEQWAVIPFAKDYEASTTGNIRRATPGKGTYRGRPKIQVIKRDTCGRPFATVSFPDVTKRRYSGEGTRIYKVSVCVLSAFIGPRPSRYHMASHLNDRPLDNRLVNLAWETQSQNERRKHANGYNGFEKERTTWRNRMDYHEKEDGSKSINGNGRGVGPVEEALGVLSVPAGAGAHDRKRARRL